MSAFMYASNSRKPSVRDTIPCDCNFAFTSASAAALCMARARRAIACAGTLAGATKPNHVAYSNPGIAASLTLGASNGVRIAEGVVTANAIGLNPVLTASVNSAAGVMGKMISVQSIAVAVAATGMTRDDESRLFRFTIKHSVLLMMAMGVISLLFAYVFADFVPVVPPK